MTDDNRCPTCGALLLANTPAGQCARCLLSLAEEADELDFDHPLPFGRGEGRGFAPRLDFRTGANPGRMALGDLDGDGRLDLAVPLEVENAVQVWINRSTPGHVDFAPPVRFVTDAGPLTAVIADLDGDGPPEIITANFHGTLTVMRNALPPKAP